MRVVTRPMVLWFYEFAETPPLLHDVPLLWNQGIKSPRLEKNRLDFEELPRLLDLVYSLLQQIGTLSLPEQFLLDGPESNEGVFEDTVRGGLNYIPLKLVVQRVEPFD